MAGPATNRGNVAETTPLRVGVLFGGRSGEHEVSIQSARAVVRYLGEAGFSVVPIGITREGRWFAGGDTLASTQPGDVATGREVALVPQPGRGLVGLDDGRPTPAGSADVPVVDVLFPVLHGTYGEDGTIQGLLDLAGIPYVGSGVLGSAAGMDKVFQKALWRGLGLPVVDWLPFTRDRIQADLEGVLDEVEAALGYPCFTKPANLGSSVGVSKARTRAELCDGLIDAAAYDARLLVERGLDVRELECGVLGNEVPVASVVGEIVPNADFYSYRAKYLDSGSRTEIPAAIPPAVSERVQELALAAFGSVNAAGLARVDCFLERDTGRVYLNEINTMPGFTSISMYPKLWEASGIPFPRLVERLVRFGVERHAERAASRTTYDIAPG